MEKSSLGSGKTSMNENALGQELKGILVTMYLNPLVMTFMIHVIPPLLEYI